MTWGRPADAPASDNSQLLNDLAADLRVLNYTVDGVADLLGPAANAALGRDQLVPALLRTRKLLAAAAPDGLAVVVHLWLLGQPVSTAALTAALPSTGAVGAAALGLVEAHHELWRAAVDLRPYSADDGADLWVASDLGSQQRPGVLRRDHVLGIGQASLSLAQLVIRNDVERALDVGTGCGIQIFHLLRHVSTVVATDISARALAFARFNLLLNAAALELDPLNLDARVDLRRGNLLEPVVGERFDLVVSNPPFVITPRPEGEEVSDRFTYRDGGLSGDDIVAGLVRGIPDVLTPGGTAQLLGNWEIRSSAPSTDPLPGEGNPAVSSWYGRLKSWLPDGADAWIIQREEISPEEYAEMWLRDAAENRDRRLYESAYSGYLRDFGSRQVEAIGFGMLWMRRSARQGRLRRFEEITHSIEQPLAPHLAAGVARSDWLTAREDQALAAERLILAEDVTEERHQRPGAEHPGVILLRQGGGLRRTMLLSSELTGFVSVCDGELTVGQILIALAALLDREDSDLGSALLPEVRNLVQDGFLLPLETESAGSF